MNIRFSVAIPAYNAAAFIGETLESVLGQSLPPTEVIVADDGSTDDTAQIAERFGPRVRCLRLTNGGPGAARKAAVEQCSGDWIALCDADDLWATDHLARKAQLIACFPRANLLFANFLSIGPAAIPGHSGIASAPNSWPTPYTAERDGNFVLLRDPYRALLGGDHCIYPSGMAYRADMYRKVGGIDPAFSRLTAEDAEFLRRFALNPVAVIAGDLRATWSYRRHGANWTANGWKSDLSRAQIFEAHLAKGIIPANWVPAVTKAMHDATIEAFNYAYWCGAWSDASTIFSRIPLQLRSPRIRMRLAKARMLSLLHTRRAMANKTQAVFASQSAGPVYK